MSKDKQRQDGISLKSNQTPNCDTDGFFMTNKNNGGLRNSESQQSLNLRKTFNDVNSKSNFDNDPNNRSINKERSSYRSSINKLERSASSTHLIPQIQNNF